MIFPLSNAIVSNAQLQKVITTNKFIAFSLNAVCELQKRRSKAALHG